MANWDGVETGFCRLLILFCYPYRCVDRSWSEFRNDTNLLNTRYYCAFYGENNFFKKKKRSSLHSSTLFLAFRARNNYFQRANTAYSAVYILFWPDDKFLFHSETQSINNKVYENRVIKFCEKNFTIIREAGFKVLIFFFLLFEKIKSKTLSISKFMRNLVFNIVPHSLLRNYVRSFPANHPPIRSNSKSSPFLLLLFLFAV